MIEVSDYWIALEIELTGLFRVEAHVSIYDSTICDCVQAGRVSRAEKSTFRTRLVRLPQMFVAIHEILHSLLPGEAWTAIDRGFDIQLLVQELENEACDLISLIRWLGDLLQQYCLPERGQSITAMTSTIQDGVRSQDVSGMMSGLKQLFDILEAMKLVSLHYL